MKDLDLNGDGVVDFSEFRRWYLSGMKSYSGAKRTLLKFKQGVAKFANAVENPKLVEFIKKNAKTTCHKMNLLMNATAASTARLHAKLNVAGPEYLKWMKKATSYHMQRGVDEIWEGSDYVFADVTMQASPDVWQKIEPIVDEIRSLVQESGDHFIDVSYAGNKIKAELLLIKEKGFS